MSIRRGFAGACAAVGVAEKAASVAAPPARTPRRVTAVAARGACGSERRHPVSRPVGLLIGVLPLGRPRAIRAAVALRIPRPRPSVASQAPWCDSEAARAPPRARRATLLNEGAFLPARDTRCT